MGKDKSQSALKLTLRHDEGRIAIGKQCGLCCFYFKLKFETVPYAYYIYIGASLIFAYKTVEQVDAVVRVYLVAATCSIACFVATEFLVQSIIHFYARIWFESALLAECVFGLDA